MWILSVIVELGAKGEGVVGLFRKYGEWIGMRVRDYCSEAWIFYGIESIGW